VKEKITFEISFLLLLNVVCNV